MNLQPGDTIGGRYEIVRALTPGNQGLTYLAKDTEKQGNAQCVVKQLKPRMSSTSILQKAQKRFTQEATILRRLGSDEQIPQLWDDFEEEREFYLVQEFIPGEDLSKELKKHKPFSETQTIDLLVDVLGILEFVHQQRVIHRDIKPSNLIRRQSDRKIVLIDFGVVKELGTLSIDPQSQTLLTQPVGTLAYMPPEQQEGRPSYSSDIYALGVTAIEALIGTLPQQDDDTKEIIWHDRVQASGKLVEILDKMVRRKLSDRYQSVLEVLEDLEPLTKIGETLAGRYQLTAYLGGGIFGHTYLAENRLRRYQSRCIIKQLQPNSKDPVVLQQAGKLFETEVNVLKELGSHSQIPELIDDFEIEEEFYLVQEFIEGEEFSHEIANGKRLSQDRVVEFLLDVLQILEFIHARNVIHCDIKPSNLIRRQSDGKIVLIDFGAVKKIVNLTMKVTPIGTPGYMPSEQMSGTTMFASDFYALGVTAIQALTGISPDRFPKDTQTGEIVWQKDIQIHPKLAQILDKMVRYDFRQRYRYASQVIKELRKLPRSNKKNTKNLDKFKLAAGLGDAGDIDRSHTCFHPV
jgi:serine/threonine protein kinase